MTASKGPFTLTENSWCDTSLYDGSGRRVVLLSIEYDCDENSQADWEKRQALDAALLLESLNVHEQTGKTPAELAASLADGQAEIARLRGALESARSYGSESWATWLISEVDDALDTK